MELKQTILGNKQRCFDIRSHRPQQIDGKSTDGEDTEDVDFLLSACEDGTAKLWRVKRTSFSAKCEHTFTHNKKNEVLRVSFINGLKVICTSGADGNVIVWAETKPVEEIYDKAGTKIINYRRFYEQACTLGHGEGQIYVCERLHAPSPASEGLAGGIITAADNVLYLWDLGSNGSSEPRTWTFENLAHGYDEAYGGPRNEERMAFIFDAKSSNRNPQMLVVALSDGTVRIVDLTRGDEEGNGVCDKCINVASVIGRLDSSSSRGAPPHVTMVALSQDDKTLLVCLGNGKVAVFYFEDGLQESPILIDLINAHTSSCFGAAFLDTPSHKRKDHHDHQDHDDDNTSDGDKVKRRRVNASFQCFTWSSDGSLARWDLQDLVLGKIEVMKTLPPPETRRRPSSRLTLPNSTPIYCAHVVGATSTSAPPYLVCGGGSGSQSFMGIPLYLVSLSPL